MKREILKYIFAGLILFLIMSSPLFSQAQVNKFKAAASLLSQTREQFMQIKNQGPTEERFIKTQNFLASLVDNTLSRLNIDYERTAKNQNISAEIQVDILTNLQEKIDFLINQKDNISEATTIEELKDVGRKIQNGLTEQKKVVREANYARLNARLNLITTKTEETIKKFNKVIDLLKASGMDTTEIETRLENYQIHTEEVKEKFSQAQKLLESGDHETSLVQIKKAKDQLRQTVEESLEIFTLIKNYLQTLKNQ